MKRLTQSFIALAMLMMLFITSLPAAQAQDGTAGLAAEDAWRAAVADMGTRLGLNLTPPQTAFSFLIEAVSDTTLGCEVAKNAGFSSQPISPPIYAYFMSITYNNVAYSYRVTKYNNAVLVIPCDSKLLTPAAPTPATTSGTCNIVADAEGVKIRKGAGTDHAQIGALPAGVVKAANNRSPDGQWLWLVDGGWVAKVSVRVTAGDCNALPTSTYVATVDAACPPLPARLYIGARGRVTAGGVGNSFSSKPQAGSVILEIPPLGEFTVIGNPQCDSETGIAWWPVEYQGRSGWTPQGDPLSGEYWIEPVPGQAPAPTQAPATAGSIPAGACSVTRNDATFGSLRTQPTTDAPRAGYICPHETLVATMQSTDGEWLLTSMGWVKKSIIELGGVCSGLTAGSAEFPAPGVAGECPAGTALVNLTVGSNGRVVDNGYPNDILTQPRDMGTGGVAFVGQIPSGATFQVTGGPMCDQTGMVWWEVKYSTFSGWTAQGIERCGQGWWLAPAQGAATTVYVGGSAGAAPPGPAGSGGVSPTTGTPIHTGNVANLTAVGTISIPGEAINDIAWLSENTGFFVSTATKTVKQYTLPGLTEAAIPQPVNGSPMGISHDGRYLVTQGQDATCAGDKAIILYDLETNTGQTVACDPGIRANDIVVHPQDWWLAASSGWPEVTTDPVENAVLYVTLSNQAAQKSPTSYPVRTVQVSADGNLTGILDTQSLQIWHSNTGIAPLSIPAGIAGEGAIYQMGGGLVFEANGASDTGYTLAVIDKVQVQIIRVTLSGNALSSQTQSTIAAPEGGLVPVRVTFNADGTLLAVGYRAPDASYQTQFYATTTGQSVAIANGIQALSFSPDGTLLAALKIDGALEMYGIK
ncbi:MAG: WD40 repeat domain-containing protein [Anaerolineae bacterium]|nr:WD40 repeat domain-containing protein [Anaerolineae bacterium]